MAKDAIEAVKAAEDKAKSILDEAVAKSKNLVVEAEKAAEDEYKQIITSAEEEAKKIKDKYLQEAEKISKPIIDQGNIDAEKMLSTKDNALEGSINIIIERIVNANGNS